MIFGSDNKEFGSDNVRCPTVISSPDFYRESGKFSEKLGKYSKIREKGENLVFAQKKGRFMHSNNQE